MRHLSDSTLNVLGRSGHFALFAEVDLMAASSACSELVKLAGVAPTELQELGGGSQSQPTT